MESQKKEVPQAKIELYKKQMEMLKMFLERNAITKEQYEKSSHDLTEKMGMQSVIAENK